eukprot:CAMPEP_0196657334 /NCGR_PEP_ID=MMETSP1086-20130531/22619_1 /TAXON_ID=77921 /ORGANISM="Cyanoptyche  gloeocystis , Strain SAG4.97" /LENGTH=94 /DNA_ID=CAMNT_0041990405 /DNA_START=50 /DNA_END=334 /DNA_ORIENTATION=+
MPRPSAKEIMASCPEMKEAYLQCFNSWYSDKFLKGDLSVNPCVAEWADYQECVKSFIALRELSDLSTEATGAASSSTYSQSSSSTRSSSGTKST